MEINGTFNPISAKRARDVLGVTSEFSKRSRNVIDYGAKLDGTDDTGAFKAARAATAKNGVIDIPQGQFVKSQEILDGPEAGKVFWRLSGNAFGSGTRPVLGMGFDAIESVINGGKYFGRQNSKPNDGPVVRIDSTINSTQSGETGSVRTSSMRSRRTWSSRRTCRRLATSAGRHRSTSVPPHGAPASTWLSHVLQSVPRMLFPMGRAPEL
jgi:hypothetical protein